MGDSDGISCILELRSHLPQSSKSMRYFLDLFFFFFHQRVNLHIQSNEYSQFSTQRKTNKLLEIIALCHLFAFSCLFFCCPIEIMVSYLIAHTTAYQNYLTLRKKTTISEYSIDMMQLEYKENLILTNGSNSLVMKQKHILRSLIRCYVFCRPCILDHVISSLELFLS